VTTVLLCDDSSLAHELLAGRVVAELGWDVRSVTDPERVGEAVDAAPPPDIAVVDLVFPSCWTGLDVLLAVHDASPATRLVIYTQGDAPVVELLQAAWEALPVAAALSKAMPADRVCHALRAVERGDPVPVDVVLRPFLPASRSGLRTRAAYGRLVEHAGHAKLWRALIELGDEASYDELASHMGVLPVTVRHYRVGLRHELALHGLTRPEMRHLQRFAKTCRPLLQSHIDARLPHGDGGAGDGTGPP